MEAGVGLELTGDYRDVTPWVFGTSEMAGKGNGRPPLPPRGGRFILPADEPRAGDRRKQLVESGPGRRVAFQRDWKGPHVFCSQRLESHLVIGTAFALLGRQRQLALPWQPGSIHFQLSPESPLTTAEPRKTCLKSESHEQKFPPGNCEGLKKNGVVMFPPCLVN